MTWLALLLAAAPPPAAQGWETVARPILVSAGCSNAACHGSTLAPLKLLDRPVSRAEAAAELEEAWKLVDPARPEESVLLQKAFGGLDHLGGKNLEPSSCEAKQLAAWISGRLETCTPRLRTRTPPEPMSGPLPPETDPLFKSCASASCHGGAARPTLSQTDRALNAQALKGFGNGYAPSDSALFKVLLGAKKHTPTFKGPEDVARSAAGRSLFAWMATERGATPRQRLPSYADFGSTITPYLEKRGCSSSACHGNGGADLLLTQGTTMQLDNYLRLLPRLADGSFLDKAQNRVAHGGGLHLGQELEKDCVARQVQRWMNGQPLKACPAPAAPSKETFVSAVQPALELLKCHSCHAKGNGGFRLVKSDGTAATLDANYEAVVGFVDLDFPPVSRVLQRVREPCLQNRIISWVAGKPQPGCEPQSRP